jgi:hypothetical protein
VNVESHLLFETHGLLHPPQLPWSVWKFTQTLPQRFGRFALLQDATHDPPLHVNVPFNGRAGQLTHALPHWMEPCGHPQLPLLQLAPEGHEWPQPPQLFTSFDVFTLQPELGL